MLRQTEIKKPTSVKEVFEAFNSLKALIIGDVMIDSYIWGKVDRISPEAPVPIVGVQKRETRLGGAANVALNIQSLGATPILCSIVGNDLDGDNFITLLKESRLSHEGIVKSKERITTIKHRIICGSHHMLRVDQENDHELSPGEKNNLVSKISLLIKNCDVVIFEDYDKGVLSEDIINQIISLAKSLNIPTVVDPKKRNFLHYKEVSLFKPNKKEMKEGLKLDNNLSIKEDIDAASQLLMSKINAENVLITLSEQGIFHASKSESLLLPAHKREITDVSGAGDTVISVAGLCMALGLAPKVLTELSNLAGGLVCEQVGVVPINKEHFLNESSKINIVFD